jgi:hypothetical protein
MTIKMKGNCIMSNAVNHELEYSFLFGIDWADQKHDICSSDNTIDSDDPGQHLEIGSKPELVRAWIRAARQRFPNGRFGVGVELKNGPLINILVDYDFIDIYPINPNSLASYRRTFNVNGAKDDIKDSRLLLDLVMHHRKRFKTLEFCDNTVRELDLLCETRRQIIDSRTRYNNKLKSILKSYYPLFLDVCGEDLYASMALNLFERFPTFDSIKKARKDTIHKVYHGLKCYQKKVIDKRINIIKSAEPVTNDAVIINASLPEAKLYASILSEIQSTVNELDIRIESLFSNHEDAYIFEALPGAGSALAPRLLAAIGSNREQFKDANEIQSYCGVAPIRVSSGTSNIVKWRYGCSKYLRQTFIEFAKASIGSSMWAEAFYKMQMARGKSHQAAVRSLAFKWIRIIFRLWQNRERYDEMKYLQCLQKSKSPLLEYFGT